MYCKSFPQKINEKPQVIADYESGKAIPNNQVLGKVERAIGKNYYCAVSTSDLKLNVHVCYVSTFSRVHQEIS